MGVLHVKFGILRYLAINPGYPPVNIPIPTKIRSKMGGAPTLTWDPIGFDPQPNDILNYLARRSFIPPHKKAVL